MQSVRLRLLSEKEAKRMNKQFACLLSALSAYLGTRWAPGAGTQPIGDVSDYDNRTRDADVDLCRALARRHEGVSGLRLDLFPARLGY